MTQNEERSDDENVIEKATPQQQLFLHATARRREKKDE